MSDLRKAVTAATSAWGGMYFPIVDIAQQASWRRGMELLAVDFLWPIMSTVATDSAARETGWSWRGMKQYGAFAEPEDESNLLHRVLRADEWLPAPDLKVIAPKWSGDDPLSDLFSTWFGMLDTADRLTVSRYLPVASEVAFSSSGAIPNFPGFLTPLGLTGRHIDYNGDRDDVGILVLDPANVAHLIQFWDIRASGGGAIPWPIGYGPIFEPIVRRFLEGLSRDFQSTGGEAVGERHVRIAVLDSTHEEMPDELSNLLAEFELQARPLGSPGGWYRAHPLMTDYSQDFSSTAEAEDRTVIVSLPSLSLPRKTKGWPGVIAADITIHRDDVGPDRTSFVPRLRRMSNLLYVSDDLPTFQRSVGEGGVYGLQASAKTVRVPLVHSLDMFAEIFDSEEFTFDQSDDGRFATRLAQTLGGTVTAAASQPAVRSLLMAAAEKSETGIPFPHLLRIAEDARGDWPHPLMRSNSREYARDVVMWLLQRKLLRPVLPVKCPKCRNESVLNPGQILPELVCEFCSWTFALGTSLGTEGSRANWRYTLAGHVPKAKLKAALPVLATNSVLSACTRSAPSLPKLDGLMVNAASMKAEFDIAVVLDAAGPTVVLGEVKTANKIDAKDIGNLVAAQRMLRAKGVECQVLVATLKDRFAPEEISLLRNLCENSPEVLHSYEIMPLLPIVWAGRELSVPWSSEEHPWRGEDHWRGIASIALNSCKRNLALESWSFAPDGRPDRRIGLSWREM